MVKHLSDRQKEILKILLNIQQKKLPMIYFYQKKQYTEN